MTTSLTPDSRGNQFSSLSLSNSIPYALDFAELLQARQEMERLARTYLNDLLTQIRVALEKLGYQEIHFELLDVLLPPEIAAGTRAVISMRLPSARLKDPVFNVCLPLMVSDVQKLQVQDAQINHFIVPESFIHPLDTDLAHVAEILVQGLCQRYMNHLRQTGGCSSLPFSPDPRRQYLAGLKEYRHSVPDAPGFSSEDLK